MLLAEISQFSKTVESKFLFDNWNEYKSVVSSEASSPLVQILITIGNLAGNISKIAIEDIKGKCVGRGSRIDSPMCHPDIAILRNLHLAPNAIAY